jgi:hypothetical protein
MLGSYYKTPSSFYEELPAETPFWQQAPVPGWGKNPMRAGPRRVGIGADTEPVTIDPWAPDFVRARFGIPGEDRVLPRYVPVGMSGCGCGPLSAAEEDVYKQTTWGHVALAASGGIVFGLLAMYLYMASKK